MDFVDEVRTRSERFARRVRHWESERPTTEEATKTSMVLPFIQMLGTTSSTPPKWYRNSPPTLG